MSLAYRLHRRERRRRGGAATKAAPKEELGIRRQSLRQQVTGSEGVEFIHENSGGFQGVRRGRKKSKPLLFRKIARIERTKNVPS
jgi:hypothetical protein